MNAHGFRGPDVPAARSGRSRVLAIGDSFTWGWGVADEATWPRRLEERLRADGVDAEVLNLGRPGMSTASYAAVAERAVPVLRPDLVLVGVHTGDDLWQTLHGDRDWVAPGAPAPWWRVVTLPNVRRLAQEAATSRRVPTVREKWAAQAAAWLAKLDDAGRAGYAALPASVRSAFEEGRLNPAMVDGGLSAKDWFRPLDPASADPAVRAALDATVAHLRTIARVCRESGARAAVVAVPDGVYASPAALAARRALGFDVDPSLLDGDRSEAAVREAAAAADVPCVSVRAALRAVSAEADDLYFPFDGHPTARGADLLARSIAPVAVRVLRER